jgi:hypothetical protein
MRHETGLINLNVLNGNNFLNHDLNGVHIASLLAPQTLAQLPVCDTPPPPPVCDTPPPPVCDAPPPPVCTAPPPVVCDTPPPPVCDVPPPPVCTASPPVVCDTPPPVVCEASPPPCESSAPCEPSSPGGGIWQTGLINLDVLNANSFLNHDFNGLNVASVFG